MTRQIVLVGLRGTGKTTVGRLVADTLGWPFADCDAAVQQDANATVAELFTREGEAGFRARESAALDGLLQRQPLVLATGGGAILSEANRERIRQAGLVVWLQADPDVLAARIHADAHSATLRPTLTGLPVADELRTLLATRTRWYQAVASMELDAGKLSPADATQHIVRVWLDLAGD